MNLKRVLKYISEKDIVIEYKKSSLFIVHWKDNNKDYIHLSLGTESNKEISIEFCLNSYPKICELIKKMRIKDFFDAKQMICLREYVSRSAIKKIHKLKMRKTTIINQLNLIEYMKSIEFQYDKDKINIKKMSKIKRNMFVYELTRNIRLIDIIDEKNKEILKYLIDKKIKHKKIDNDYAINNIDIVKDIYKNDIKTGIEIVKYLEKIDYKNIEHVISDLLISVFIIKSNELRKRAYELNKQTILRNYINKRGSKSYLRSFILKELCICPKNVKEIINEETEKEKIGYIMEVLKYLFENKYNNDNDRKEKHFNNQLIGNDCKFYLENIDIKEFILSLDEKNPKLKEIEDFIYLFDYARIEKQLQNF